MKLEGITPEVIQWLQNKMESMEGFVAREALALANEIVAWYFWSSIAGLFLSIAIGMPLLIAGLSLLRRCRKMTRSEDWEPYAFFGAASTFAGVLVTVLAGGLCLEGAIKAKVAPRLVVLEHITGQVDK